MGSPEQALGLDFLERKEITPDELREGKELERLEDYSVAYAIKEHSPEL